MRGLEGRLMSLATGEPIPELEGATPIRDLADRESLRSSVGQRFSEEAARSLDEVGRRSDRRASEREELEAERTAALTFWA